MTTNHPSEKKLLSATNHASHGDTFLDLRGNVVFQQEPPNQRLSGTSSCLEIALVSNEHLIVHTGDAVALHHLPTGVSLWTLHCASSNVAFHPQQNLLALAPDDLREEEVILWDMRTAQILHPLSYVEQGFPCRVNPSGLAFSPDGTMLAVSLQLQDEIADDEEIEDEIADDEEIEDEIPDEDSKSWNLLMLFDILKKQVILTIKTYNDDITAIAFHPSENIVAGGSFNNHLVWLWSLTDGRLLHRWDWERGKVLTRDRCYNLAFSPDGKRLFAACGDAGLCVWDIQAEQEIAGPPMDILPIDLTVSPDTSMLAVSLLDHTRIHDTVLVLEPKTWRVLHQLKGQHCSLSFSPDGQLFATFREENCSIFVWDMDTGQLRYKV